MFDAIFWDNDGVLMETEHLYYQANATVLAEHGLTLTLADFCERSLRRGESVLQLAGVHDTAVLRDRRDTLYDQLLGRDARLMPGIMTTLQQLHGRQPMAIVTSCRRPHFERMHQSSGLLPFFDFVLTREDYVAGKPDPEPYLTACRRAGVDPSRCLAVEDSERGVTSAARAGLTVAALPGRLGGGGDYAAARWCLEGINELPALLGLSAA
jgi:HAD superfamily hydrolase (TIGR01509 family)